MTPAIKGQLTRTRKLSTDGGARFRALRTILARIMPPEQAKHAARAYLRTS